MLVIILRAGAVEVDCGAAGKTASVKLDMLQVGQQESVRVVVRY